MVPSLQYSISPPPLQAVSAVVPPSSMISSEPMTVSPVFLMRASIRNRAGSSRGTSLTAAGWALSTRPGWLKVVVGRPSSRPSARASRPPPIAAPSAGSSAGAIGAALVAVANPCADP